MKVIREYVRALLLEEIGRSYHTPNVDPIDIMEQEGIRVSSYFNSSTDSINVAIEKYNKKTDEWEEILDKEFSDPLDAQFWMRQQVERYQRKNFSKDLELTDQD